MQSSFDFHGVDPPPEPPKPPPPPPEHGGGGGPEDDDLPSRSDMLLWQTAIEGRWQIGPRMRLEILRRCARSIARNKRRDDRYALRAATVVIAADRLNLETEKLDFVRGVAVLPSAQELLGEAERLKLEFDRPTPSSAAEAS